MFSFFQFFYSQTRAVRECTLLPTMNRGLLLYCLHWSVAGHRWCNRWIAAILMSQFSLFMSLWSRSG